MQTFTEYKIESGKYPGCYYAYSIEDKLGDGG